MISFGLDRVSSPASAASIVPSISDVTACAIDTTRMSSVSATNCSDSSSPLIQFLRLSLLFSVGHELRRLSSWPWRSVQRSPTIVCPT